jgi:hypothetical protein
LKKWSAPPAPSKNSRTISSATPMPCSAERLLIHEILPTPALLAAFDLLRCAHTSQRLRRQSHP